MAEIKPRPYQVELCQRALDSNSIVYLPTGAGKTFIAVLMIKKLNKDARKLNNNAGKKTIFIVNTVPLVVQQANYINKHSGLKCQGYSSENTKDTWQEKHWIKQFQINQVLVFTAQIFFDILARSYITLSQINLIIFDECHHAVKSHPMREIMKLFETCPKHQQPKVVGLTATLLNSNVENEKINSFVHDLEITFNAKVITVDTSNINVINEKNITETYVEFDNFSTNAVNLIDNDINNMMAVVRRELNRKKISSSRQFSLKSSRVFQAKPGNKKLINLFEDIDDCIKSMGLFAGHQAVISQMANIYAMKKNSCDESYKKLLQVLINELRKLNNKITSIINSKRTNGLIKIQTFSSDKIIKLFTTIYNYYSACDDKKNFCCIIFVTRRTTVYILYSVLKNLRVISKEFKFIKPDYVLGSSGDTIKNFTGSKNICRQNKEVLNNFRNGEINCLVATDVVDEGVDIPNCSLIVRYDAPQDYRSYIQSKGRARHKSSQVTFLVDKNDSKLYETYTLWKEIEQSLSDVSGDPDARADPLPEDIIKKLYATEVKPYIATSVEGKKSILTDVASLSLVSRYCNTLIIESEDQSCLPTYKLHPVIVDGKEYFYVSLKLPESSRLQDTIKGDLMSSVLLAKRSAAMKACITLHKIGELNDTLLPVKQKAINKSYAWNHENNNSSKVVNIINNIQVHSTIYPESLWSAYPVPYCNNYLHILEIESIDTNLNDNYLIKNKIGYAILTNKKFPVLPSFPIDIKDHEFMVNVKINCKLTLNPNEIKNLFKFHWFIFNDVLKIIKSFMMFDKEHLENSFLVVPVDSSWKINWNIIDEYKLGDKKFDNLNGLSCSKFFNDYILLLRNMQLPIILERISDILIADDLRRKIILETGLGQLEVAKWPPVKLSSSINYSSVIINENATKLEKHNARKNSDSNKFKQNIFKCMINSDYHGLRGKLSLSNKDIIIAKLNKSGYSVREELTPPILNALNIKFDKRIGPSPVDIMCALTTMQANSLFNLERIETLGDAFLKYITTIYLFEKYNNDNEGVLSIYKSKIVGNQKLLLCGEKKGIPGRMKFFVINTNDNFVIPSFCVPKKLKQLIFDNNITMNILNEIKIPKEEQIYGKMTLKTEKLHVNKITNGTVKLNPYEKTGLENLMGKKIAKDKCIADCVEALIGTYLQTMGLEGAKKLIQWFEIIDHNEIIENIISGRSPNSRINNGDPIDHLKSLNFIENVVGYKFNDCVYLLQALTHSSSTSHNITMDYQRLEFIGDAIIDFLITLYIFDHCDDLSSGDMTDLRSALVNNIMFACLTVKYGLHLGILHDSSIIQEAIDEFYNFQANKSFNIDYNLLSINYQHDNIHIGEHINVPKILSDIFESIIGAIYLDCGKNLNIVWEILYGLMKNEICKFKKNIPVPSVRFINEKPLLNPQYTYLEKLDNDIYMIRLEMTIDEEQMYFNGFGVTNAFAKSAAAKLAMDYIIKNNIN
ncbi:hypothetical protein HCN44_007621 [Aphidius gifuensis]|uniref:Dicer-like protein n=1 Tax=Aphidius gifuensis TaxID=684658 RepID=A0A835CLD2_APHGI|nr:hypothetical protein HCN44_007621 [Aphidius gifuensis]